MKRREDEPIIDFDVGSATASDSEDITQDAEDSELQEEKHPYIVGKPTRIVIRARIIHD